MSTSGTDNHGSGVGDEHAADDEVIVADGPSRGETAEDSERGEVPGGAANGGSKDAAAEASEGVGADGAAADTDRDLAEPATTNGADDELSGAELAKEQARERGRQRKAKRAARRQERRRALRTRVDRARGRITPEEELQAAPSGPP